MNSETPLPVLASPEKKSPSVKVIGIGSAGAGVLEQLARGGLFGASLGLVHSDPLQLGGFSEVEKFHLDPKTLATAGNYLEPKSKEATPVSGLLDRLRPFYHGSDVLIIISGMGGVL